MVGLRPQLKLIIFPLHYVPILWNSHGKINQDHYLFIMNMVLNRRQKSISSFYPEENLFCLICSSSLNFYALSFYLSITT